jgi:hypothetical protein
MTAEHGTASRYRNDGCRCQSCRDASAAKMREFRSQPHDPDSIRHGELSTYVNFRCRCAECSAASNAYERLRWQRAKAQRVERVRDEQEKAAAS